LKQQQASVCECGEWPPLRCRRLSVRICWAGSISTYGGRGAQRAGRREGGVGWGAAASLVCPLCRSLHKPSTCPPSHPPAGLSTWLFERPPTHPPTYPLTHPSSS
jgi:hypothetical protein